MEASMSIKFNTVKNSKEQNDERYEKYLRVVDANTGTPNGPNPQPAMAKVSSVGITLSNAGYRRSEINSTRRAAVQNDDLLQLDDRDGRKRVCRKTEDALRAVLGELNEDPERYGISRERMARIISEVQE
jgi:hypothetical protein